MSFFLTLQSYDDIGLLALRLALAAIFWVHGTSKLAMWKMQPSEQLPAPMLRVMRLLSVCEPLGAIAMVLGFLTQLASVGFIIIMLGAINLKRGMFKQKFSMGQAVGWEFEFLIALASLALVFLGPGAYALDRVWFGL